MSWLRIPLAASTAFFVVGTPSDLSYSGSDRVHEKTVRAVFTGLPARGKQITVMVREVRPEEWKTVDDEGESGAVGVYDDEERTIYLKSGERDLDFTFAHEYGHHVYFCTFTGAERRTWRRFWRMNRREMPDAYAREDPDEGFAECYAGNFYGQGAPWRLSPLVREQVASYFQPAE